MRKSVLMFLAAFLLMSGTVMAADAASVPPAKIGVRTSFGNGCLSR